MKFGSVCSGIEAASVAWQPLGWKAQWFSEIEPFPCALLKHHYPATPNLGDMTQFESWPTDDQHAIDLLCGGTPCQSFSVAGLRAGLDDPRGNLMLTFGAIAAKYRPQWLVWENVPGVLSSNGGRDFGTFLGMLGQLGYGFAYRVLDAQYFGVAQRRRRVFVVGYSGDWRRAAAVLFERHSLQGHPAPGREAGKGFAAVTAPSLTASGRGVERCGESRGQDPVIAVPERERALTTSNQRIDAETETFIVSHSLRGEGFDASEDGTGRGAPLAPVCMRESGQGFWMEDEIAGTLRAEGEDRPSRPSHVIGIPTAYRTAGDGAVFEEGDITAPLTTGTDPCANIITGAMPSHVYSGDMGGRVDAAAQGFAIAIQGTLINRSDTAGPAGPAGSGISEDGISFTLTKNDKHAVQTAMQVRRLTPEECEALQGFKRGYTLVPHRGKPAADGPRYKALGNSWAVPNVRWIGERIEAVALIKPAQPATETIAKPTPETELSA